MKWKGHKGNQIENEYSHWIWRQYASAFWDDIRIDRTLGTGAGLYSANKAEKDEADEKHMHPLQLDVIERALVLYTNEGETVWTPFLGVGSEVYGAVTLGRRGIGVELKPAYYRQAVQHLRAATEAMAAQAQPRAVPASEAPTLF
jgi:DNA modification methylase